MSVKEYADQLRTEALAEINKFDTSMVDFKSDIETDNEKLRYQMRLNHLALTIYECVIEPWVENQRKMIEKYSFDALDIVFEVDAIGKCVNLDEQGNYEVSMGGKIKKLEIYAYGYQFDITVIPDKDKHRTTSYPGLRLTVEAVKKIGASN